MIDVIIPVWNIRRRGLQRVYYSCLSLLQTGDVNNILVIDGSKSKEYNDLSELLKGLKVKHIHYPLEVFNKPKLLNKGINESTTEYVLCTDCDYLFKSDLLKICKQKRSPYKMLHKEVMMLPNTNISPDRIKRWKFPKGRPNRWGKLANGALQYTTREWFLANPYPEEMEGWGAMDNIMAYKAKATGLKIEWITESEILHQYHRVEKFENSMDGKRFNRNQKILSNYIKEHKLAKML